MLRVLTLSTLYPDDTRPAFGRFVERQAAALAARAGMAVRVVAPRGLPFGIGRGRPDELRAGLAVLRPAFPTIPEIGQRLNAALLAGALAPVLARLRASFPFDVIDAGFFWPDGPAAVLLGRRFGVPVSIKARGSDIHYWAGRPGVRRRLVAAARAADGLLAVSAALKRDMVALGMPADRILVHPTGVDIDRFVPVDRAAAKAALGVAGPLLATLGHLNRDKGQAIAIDALAQLPDAVLLLIGEGAAQPALAAQAARLGLSHRVRFLGRRPHDEVARLLATADVMVLPTLREGLANAWVEALACGTPVVTTDVGGAREVIDRPAAGRLVARDADAVAAAVRAILAAPPPAEAVRAGALRFTWERNAAALEAHLRDIVERYRMART